MCTGHPAFRAGNTVAVIRRVCDDTPRSIRDDNPEMTGELEEIVTRLMAKDPVARYQTATEVAESLGQHLAQVQQQGKAPRRASTGMKTRTSRRRMICVGLLLAALLGLAAWQLGLFVVRENAIRDAPRIDAPWKGKDNRPAPLSKAVWPDWPADAPLPALAPFDAAAARKHQEAWAKHLGVPVKKEFDLGDGQMLAMILIPPGEFLMGTADQERAQLLQQAMEAGDQWSLERIPSEGPQHRVRITRPFWLGRYEVTVGQFRRFVDQTGYKTEAERDGIGGYAVVKGNWVQDPKFVWNGDHDFSHADNDPVVFVSWNDAEAFCQSLAKRLDVEFKLPTEAEWEYACRAGTTTLWCGGSDVADLREYGWFGGPSAGKLHPVGQLRANGFGLYDMHGNVWEWCADWYGADHYAQSPVDNPAGPLMGSSRVQRGGDWFYDWQQCRSAKRTFDSPGARSVSLGFRVAAALSNAAVRPLKKD
jgi:formylglycine-generating enzyme required for sulfatase activity